MKRQFNSRAIGGVLLAALTLAVIFWPQRFSDFAHTDRTEARDMFVSAWVPDSGKMYYNAEVQPGEMEPLLELMNSGRLHWRGFCQSFGAEAQRIYSVTLGHQGDGGYVLDARFELLPDGTLYNVWYDMGYTRYRLTGCDMEAVDGLLREITGTVSH